MTPRGDAGPEGREEGRDGPGWLGGMGIQGLEGCQGGEGAETTMRAPGRWGARWTGDDGGRVQADSPLVGFARLWRIQRRQHSLHGCIISPKPEALLLLQQFFGGEPTELYIRRGGSRA